MIKQYISTMCSLAFMGITIIPCGTSAMNNGATLDKKLILLQQLMDKAELEPVKTFITEHGIKYQLNEEYICSYGTTDQGKTVAVYEPTFNTTLDKKDISTYSLKYAFDQYAKATTIKDKTLQTKTLHIIRYFLQDCGALLEPDITQSYSYHAMMAGDVEAVKLFATYGIYLMPKHRNKSDAEVSLADLAEQGKDDEGNNVANDLKVIFGTMCIHLSRPSPSIVKDPLPSDNVKTNTSFVELQALIDNAELAPIKRFIASKQLKDALTDMYSCKYIKNENNKQIPEYHADFDQNKTSSTLSTTLLSYSIKRYRNLKSDKMLQSKTLDIIRYFLQDCGVPFDKKLSQLWLYNFVKLGDCEAVKLFTQYGMLNLESHKNYDGIPLNLARLAALGRDDEEQDVGSTDLKEKMLAMVPYLEGRFVKSTRSNKKTIMAIAGVTIASILCIKKVYDWYYTASIDGIDEDEDQEQTDDHK